MAFALALLACLATERSNRAEPPRNPHLADSTWPIFHANSYATASTLASPPVDPDAYDAVDNLTFRRRRPGLVSPWTVLRAPTAEGEQIVITSPTNGVAKYVITNGRLRGIDFLRLDRRFTDFDWNILLLADGSAVVTEKRHNRFAIIGDRDADPRSPLTVRRRLPVDRDRYGKLASFTVSYDGRLITSTFKPALLALDLDNGSVLAEYVPPQRIGRTVHNAFPIDERGRVYLLGQRGMAAIDWDGHRFTEAWVAEYDMRGPGFEDQHGRRPVRDAIAVARGEPGTGSGTTPTLLGDPDTGVVVVVDGHSPQNHLVAFWRGTIPEDWQALPDPHDPAATLDRRVAGVLALPHSTPEGEGHIAECSPAALGHAVVIAQWAGFNPDATPPKGVQRVDWDPQRRRFELQWANPDIHINGVPTIGRGPDGPRVLGMGREGDRYVYSVLDLDTGRRVTRIDLGSSDAVLDQGNNHAIAADGSIIYGGKGKLVHVHQR